MYRITWKHKATGLISGGTAVFGFAEAQRLCDGMNRKHPLIHHWPELGAVCAYVAGEDLTVATWPGKGTPESVF